MISQKEARDWCMKNRVDYNAMLDHLEREGCLVQRSEKVTLTRGTDIAIVQARCFIVDANKIDKDALTLVSNNSMSGVENLPLIAV